MPTLSSRIDGAHRASRHNPCWGCGRKEYPCFFREVEETGAHIWFCGPDQTPVYFDSRGAEVSKGEAYYGDVREAGWQPRERRQAAKPAKVVRQVVAAELTDAVYRIVLDKSPLSDEHRQQLLARPGMTAELIEAEGYATARQLDGIQLLTRHIQGASTVPGMPGPGERGFRAVPGALLIPVRNKDGLIVGIRQRVVGEDGKKKYLWLPGSMPAVHFPVVRSNGDGTVRITEGEIKATICTAATGTLHISIPGVSSWRLGLDAAIALRQDRIEIAFDSDYSRKVGVAQALAALLTEAHARDLGGTEVLMMTWPEEAGKGLDDYLGAYRNDGPTPDWRPVNATLVEEAQALAGRLLEEDAERRLSAGALPRPIPTEGDVADDDDEIEAMMAAAWGAEMAVDGQEMAPAAAAEALREITTAELRRLSVMRKQDLLLDDAARKSLIRAQTVLGREALRGMHVKDAVINLVMELDRILDRDRTGAERRALTGYLLYDRTEIGCALRMADQYKGRILYAGGLGWHVWDGKRHVRDPDGVRVAALVQQLAMDVEAEIKMARICAAGGVFGPSVDADTDDVINFSEAPGSKDKSSSLKEESEHKKFVVRCRRAAFIGAVISLLRPHVSIDDALMDAHPHLLNVQNGIVDLRDGTLLPHDPAMLMTQIAGASYDPTAPRGVWTKFFDEVMAEEDGTVDPEYIHYLQGYLGYILWGVATEQKFCSVWGAGSNGKTTLFETVADVMGSYAQTVEPELVVKADATSGAGKPRPDLLNLRGARLILASEPERGEAMAEGIVKRLTGNDKLSGRLGYSNEVVNFRIVGKFVLLCNELLRIAGTNVGIWRRQEVWACKRLWRRPDDTDPRMAGLPLVDQGLPDALRAEADGILAWMVEGAVRWHREKLRRPQRIMDASAEYRGEQDRVGQFLAERIERDDRRGNIVAQTELYTAYVDWCKASGTQPMARDRLKGALKDHSLIESRNGPVGLIWKGIRLLPAPAQPYRDGQAAGGWNNGRSSRDDSGRNGWAQPAAEQRTSVLL